MNKKIILVVAAMIICAAPLFAKGADMDKMENALAHGYLAASKNDIEGSIMCFDEALAYAEKAKSWKGCVDAGNAFTALGKPEKALAPFKKARGFANAQKDWRGLVSVAYGCASLPEKLGAMKEARGALENASKAAAGTKDWRGLIETAKACHKFDFKLQANSALGSAKSIVAELKLASAATALGKAAQELGNMPLYDECARMASSFGGGEKETVPPPPGWKPYGESVAGPKEVSVEAQVAMRASADSDIKSKREYLAAVEKKEEENHLYYAAFRNYYDYPYYHSYFSGYGFGYWQPLNKNQVCGWATHCLSNYRSEGDDYFYAY